MGVEGSGKEGMNEWWELRKWKGMRVRVRERKGERNKERRKKIREVEEE